MLRTPRDRMKRVRPWFIRVAFSWKFTSALVEPQTSEKGKSRVLPEWPETVSSKPVTPHLPDNVVSIGTPILDGKPDLAPGGVGRDCPALVADRVVTMSGTGNNSSGSPEPRSGSQEPSTHSLHPPRPRHGVSVEDPDDGSVSSATETSGGSRTESVSRVSSESDSARDFVRVVRPRLLDDLTGATTRPSRRGRRSGGAKSRR